MIREEAAGEEIVGSFGFGERAFLGEREKEGLN
jgi:hypothetical protein